MVSFFVYTDFLFVCSLCRKNLGIASAGAAGLKEFTQSLECAFSFDPFYGKECAFSFVPFYGKECAFSLREMRYKALERTNEMHIQKWLSKLASTSRSENRKKRPSQLEL